MNKHTRAPWEWLTSNDWKRLVHPVAGTQIPILQPTLNRAGHADLMINEADMALIAVVPNLLALAHQYASECGECAGTRITVHDLPCDECRFIWETIDKAEGRT